MICDGPKVLIIKTFLNRVNLCSHLSRNMFGVNMFHLNMFVNALFTSDVIFKHVSCLVV